MLVNSDFKELLKAFNDCRVRYLLIGGYAVMHYLEPRYTKDLDLWVSTDRKNALAVFRALRLFGAPLAGLTERDFETKGYFYQMGIPPVRVDVMMSAKGMTFETAWKNRNRVEFDGLRISIISRRDLIKLKRAAGRPHDLIDATNLEELDKAERSKTVRAGSRRKRSK
ncbi:MAG: hypothetical protein HZA46_00755 [Planctomycetales bacterium]|nr:hypothetical protein [Planctomycetales bacterium]